MHNYDIVQEAYWPWLKCTSPPYLPQWILTAVQEALATMANYAKVFAIRKHQPPMFQDEEPYQFRPRVNKILSVQAQ